MTIKNLKNKKIGLIGLGLENLHLVNFLLKSGISDITILDERDKEQIKDRYNELKKKGAEFRVGKNCLKNLSDFDILFRSPGFALFRQELRKAKREKIEIYSAMKLFFDLCPCSIIGVTGTKGKGTTSSLIYEMLKAGKKDAYLGGNIGVAPFEFLEKLKKDSIVVLELSSFQLEDMRKSPCISVVVNMSEEHLKPADKNNPNYHKTMRDYAAAKKNIIKHQAKKDCAILNFNDPIVRKFRNSVQGKLLYFNIGSRTEEILEKFNIKKSKLKVIGRHNLENIEAAALAAKAAGVSNAAIKKAAENFKGLPHRLEFVAEIGGVKYYDDSFSTVPYSAIIALRAFENPAVLIAGGVGKGSSFDELGKEIISRNVRAVILIGKDAGKIEKSIFKAVKKAKSDTPKLIKGCANMQEIIAAAKKEAVSGDTVILSPACASFDMFKNYKDRGDQFRIETQISRG